LTEDNSLFTETTTLTVDQLVGEDKQYKSVDELPKAIVAKENHIKTLEGENKTYREKLTALEAIVAASQTREKPANENPVVTPGKTAEVTPISDEDLANRIRAVNARVTQEDLTKSNLSVVSDKLIETFGDETKAREAVSAKASELGVSVKFLQEMAAKSPKAFFVNMGITGEQKSVDVTPSRTNVNTTTASALTKSVKPNTYQWYLEKYGTTKLLRSDVQNQMHKDALEKGDTFYAA